MDTPSDSNPLSLISDPAVASAATDRQTLRQHRAEKTTMHPLRAPQAHRPASESTPAPTYSHPPVCHFIAIVAASRARILPVQRWTTVPQKGITIPIVGALATKKGNAMERSITAEHQGLVRGPFETERRIMFPPKAGEPPKGPSVALNIPHMLNLTLSAVKIPTCIRIHRLN